MKYLILTSLLLGLVYGDLAPVIVPGYNVACPSDFASQCDLQCANGNYVLDGNGCPTCVCASICPEIKCRANCGEGGYVLDENNCQTCKCKSKVACPRSMCRMFCQHGFKRDENGCEYCACNRTPQPCPVLNCEGSCSNGYRKDYSGCNTCDCLDEPERKDKNCPQTICDLKCKFGFQRDENGCEVCACNQCPVAQCRMFCTFGFRKNQEDGCQMCECDWTPVEEKIQCDERIPCPDIHVCNQNLRLCEAVRPDRVNWFLYDFEVQNELFKDQKFVQTFKNGLIHNIATKYSLEIGQIAVSSVEENGLTSFQIMPYFNEDMTTFGQKIDQIDIDLNSHEFRAVLPAVVSAVEDGNGKPPSRVGVSKWCERFKNLIRSRTMFITMIAIMVLLALIVSIGYCNMRRRYQKLSIRSDSKTHICGTSYHLAGSEEDLREDLFDSDGIKHVIVTSDPSPASNDKRALV